MRNTFVKLFDAVWTKIDEFEYFGIAMSIILAGVTLIAIIALVLNGWCG